VKDYQQSFLNLALDSKALQFGEFTLKSGRLSPYFFNAANMLNGTNLYELAKCYVDAINDKNLDFDCIYGPAYKGIFLGSIVATLLSEQGKNYPLSFNRKEEKDHGEGGNIIGANPQGKVLIIDDVLSAGTAGRESIESIQNLNATPSSFLVGLDRQEKGQSEISSSKELENDFNIKVESIINLDTLIAFVKNQSEYSVHLSKLNQYRETWSA
jgi:orotate phosphoribosyltransferase